MMPISGRLRGEPLPVLENGSFGGLDATMSLRVKVEIQPGERVRFPNQCVSCGHPATSMLRLRKRRERMTRELEVPLCADCRHEVDRLSGDEERWLRIGWLFSAVAFVLALIVAQFLLLGWLPFLPRLVLAILAAGGIGVVVFLAFGRRRLRHARPQKLAVLNAVRLQDFSWRATTLAFADEEAARRFVALNREKIMETSEIS